MCSFDQHRWIRGTGLTLKITEPTPVARTASKNKHTTRLTAGPSQPSGSMHRPEGLRIQPPRGLPDASRVRLPSSGGVGYSTAQP